MGKPQGYLLAYQSSLAGKATCLRKLIGFSLKSFKRFFFFIIFMIDLLMPFQFVGAYPLELMQY
jgi:hypothetical protein